MGSPPARRTRRAYLHPWHSTVRASDLLHRHHSPFRTHSLHQTQGGSGLIHHSDRGVQYLSIRYSERLDENDIVASVGSRGDSYDNAMAEAFNSLYKWELIYPQGPWRGLDDVEYATLGYIDWFNHRRLHGDITDDNSYVPPAEFEATYYRQMQPADEAATQ